MLVVCGKHGNTVITFHLLQQKRCLVVVRRLVGTAIVGTLRKKGITLVEEEYDVTLLRLAEDHGDGFLRFTDVFIDNLGKVNSV